MIRYGDPSIALVSKKKQAAAVADVEPEAETDKYADMKKLALMKLLRDRDIDYSSAGGVDDLRCTLPPLHHRHYGTIITSLRMVY